MLPGSFLHLVLRREPGTEAMLHTGSHIHVHTQLNVVKVASIIVNVVQCFTEIYKYFTEVLSESCMTVWPQLEGVRNRCVLGTCTLTVVVTWLVVARSGAVFAPLHGTQVWRPSDCFVEGGVPSTTLLTVAVCAAASVQGSYAWGKVESPTLGQLKSRF